jgi:C-terminal processing protease CtpA/Prc
LKKQKIMAKKITISLEKAQQFNRMLSALRRIHKDYMTPDQLRVSEEAEFHGDVELISMSYENIQGEAKAASHGVRPIAIVIEHAPSTEI